MYPLIGITGSIGRGGPEGDINHVAIPHDYFHAIEKNGGIAVGVSPSSSLEVIEKLDGLMLSGGFDIDPSHYHQDPSEKLGRVDAIRDTFELNLLQIAIEKDIPILGICRGMQVINVHFGGTLIQDISTSYTHKLAHLNNNRYAFQHSVYLAPHTTLNKKAEEKQILVNSEHHQAIDILGKGLKAIAQSDDALIEVFEYNGSPWILGVQWHPESILHSEDANELFALYIRTIREARKTSERSLNR